MKKNKLVTFVAIAAFSVVGSTALQTVNNVEAYSAIKSYNFDRNTITGVESRFRSYVRKNIPNWSKYSTYKNQQIGGGWNFKTYRHTNFYTGGY